MNEAKGIEVERQIHFLKIHKMFVGLIPFDIVEHIARTTWKIELLTKKQ